MDGPAQPAEVGILGKREASHSSSRSRCPARYGGAVSVVVKAILFVVLIGAACAPTSGSAEPICASCELQLGFGGTYHFWGPTGGKVLAATMSWDANRYELGVFRIVHAQMLRDDTYHDGHLMASPYWGASLSRRWRIFQTGPVAAFFGFGLTLKTESDQLSVTRWDFASQLALRFRLPGQFAVGELSVRHWSNAGIRLPNHGQDFMTFTIRLNSRHFGVNATDQIPVRAGFASNRP